MYVFVCVCAHIERSCCLPIVGVTPTTPSLACEHVSLRDWSAQVSWTTALRLWGSGGSTINGQWAVAQPRTALRLAFLLLIVFIVLLFLLLLSPVKRFAVVVVGSFHLFLRPKTDVIYWYVYCLLFIVGTVVVKHECDSS